MLLEEPKKASLDLDTVDAEHQNLGKGLQYFGHILNVTRDYAFALSNGDIKVPAPKQPNEIAAPLKALRHMTWQTQQVAKGDYQQRIDYMGVSEAFNTMVVQLDDWQKALVEEIQVSQRKTRALEQSYTLLEGLANRRDELLVIMSLDGDALFLSDSVKLAATHNEPYDDVLTDWITDNLDTVKKQKNPTRREYAFQTGGERYVFSINTYPVHWSEVNAVAFVFDDISAERAKIDKLEEYAYEDSLTGLANRMHGVEVLREWVMDNKEFCLCFVYLDNLKYVNDNFGHSEGDEYIITAARLLEEFSRDVLVSRIGGDEFMLLQQNIEKEVMEERMEELRSQMQKRTERAGSPYFSSLSYGVVEVNADNEHAPSELLAMADESMYRYKRKHRDERFKRAEEFVPPETNGDATSD